MPASASARFTLADVMDRGLSNADIAQVAVAAPGKQLDADLDDKGVLSAYKRINSRAVIDVRGSRLGDLIQKFKTPLELATGFIEAKYQALGGANGFLKAATTAVTVCPDGKGYFRHFQGGSIYWHPYTGAHEVHGAIRQKWASLGWEKSFLGYPVSDETTGRDNESKGRFNHFQGGSVYWHPTVGTFEVHGAIKTKYLELGAEASFLGYPTTDETGTPDGQGRFNHFQAGSIYWTAGSWAHEVHGLIRQYWADHGWERNAALGYPITDELIPDRRMGHIRPGSIRRPDAMVPADLIRLPEEVDTPGLAVRPAGAMVVQPAQPGPGAGPPRVVRTLSAGRLAMMADRVTPAVTPAQPPAPTPVAGGPFVGRVSPAAVAMLDPNLVGILVQPEQPGFSEGAKEGGVSRNRFGDFENGVVFWKRGTTSAYALTPWKQTAGGQKLALTAAEVVAVASQPIRNAMSRLPNTQVIGVNFAGTTGYVFDGCAVHNRRHRANTTLMAMSNNGPFPIPVQASVEILIEIAFDPISWRVAGQLVEWRLLSATGNFPGGSLDRQLHGALDGAMWQPFPVLNIPNQDSALLPILSVKTMPDGDVDVYVEP